MLQRGVLKTWNDEKGFGFIAPEDGSPDVFLHISALNNIALRPVAGAAVAYSIQKDEQGRLRAGKAWIEFGKVARSPARGWGPWIAAFAVADFIGLLAVAAGYGLLPRAVPIGYLALSIVTFGAYVWDKWRARRGGDRTAEATLHLCEMLGGWPGALVAQQWLRHKSRKRSYQIRFWIIVAVHLAVWAWLGANWLNAANTRAVPAPPAQASPVNP